MISGKTMTFSELLTEAEVIEIPIIQRDYVQGRATAAEVRRQFLQTIHDTLSTTQDQLEQPLDLDFIYGSVQKKEGNKFWPLDGQQRLTTLYLLHWYLACHDGQADAFQQLAQVDEKSRFTYQTRTSSEEFFNALVAHPIDFGTLKVGDVIVNSSVSKTIRNCQWYFLSWDRDPTIQSALTMLNAIHALFEDSEGFYARLIQTENPYITFQFLNLHDFGLSDDLYIKMNARGKPLTQYENFKAKFVQHIGKLFPEEKIKLHGKEMLVKDYVNLKLDTDWTDLFWQFCEADTHLFDEKIIHFFRAITVVLYPLKKERSERFEVSGVLEEIRRGGSSLTFHRYQKLDCFDRDFVNQLIKVLDTLCQEKNKLSTYLENTAYYNEKNVFELTLQETDPRGKNPKGLSYERAIQFFAYCSYIIRYPESLNSDAFYQWMRVIHNLSENTRHNNIREFTDSLFAIIDLLDVADNLIEYLLDAEREEKIRSFYGPQIREEEIKAQLIQRSDSWRESIYRAEQHGYFKGQIEFLLDFSGVLDYCNEYNNCDWDESQDKKFLLEFNRFFEKANAVFDTDGLKDDFDDYLFERALLSQGDYLLYARSNYWFLTNSTEIREVTWKQFLRGSGRTDEGSVSHKRQYLGTLLKQIDSADPSGSLEQVIENTVVEDEWRKLIIDTPELLNFCEKNCLRINSDDNIYLMKKMQMNGAHLELRSYHLLLTYLKPRETAETLYPFSRAWTCDEFEEPGVKLWGMKLQDHFIGLDIFYSSECYQLVLYTNEEELPHEMKERLSNSMDFIEDDYGRLCIEIEKKSFQQDFDKILEALALLATN